MPTLASPGRTIAGRYRLIDRLGAGSHGEVWSAADAFGGGEVALKLLRVTRDLASARVRREVSALRLLRFPGVVRLLDEGIEQGCPFLVMERATGLPFPGAGAPVSWDSLSRPATSLLRVLERVHAASVIHRDLKPANVLVDPDGRVTILDFGVSFGRPLGQAITGIGAIMGTPAYLAPEQVSGEDVDTPADLYAVGVMLYEALSGTRPLQFDSRERMIRAKLDERPAPLETLAAGVPIRVCRVVDALLERHPCARPRSAEHVLGLIGAASAAAGAHDGGALADVLRPLSLERRIACAPRELERIFVGPERLFHLQSDAARVLHERTTGDPARVREELSLWVDAHLARVTEGRLRVDRGALDRVDAGLDLPLSTDLRRAPPPLPYAFRAADRPLSAGMTASEPVPLSDDEIAPWSARADSPHRAGDHGSRGRLVRLVAGATEDAAIGALDIAREALSLALRQATEGHLGRAIILLREGLFLARSHTPSWSTTPGPAEERLFCLWARVAIAEGTTHALDALLYELCRYAAPTPLLKALRALASGAVGALGSAGEVALARVDEAGPFDDAELEETRQGVRVWAARRCPLDRERVIVASAARWAGSLPDARPRAASATWRGRLAYRENRFQDAAKLHAEAAKREPWRAAQIEALSRSTECLVEAFRYKEAVERASRALDLCASCRSPRLEARAEWLLRAARYRDEASLEPDLELVAAIELVGVPVLEAQVLLTEAAVALRCGQPSLARDLACRACDSCVQVGNPWGRLLARSLALSLGAAKGPGELADLTRLASGCPVPGIGIQALGLLSDAFPDDRALLASCAPAAARLVPRRYWGHRIDVLSVREALARTGASPRASGTVSDTG